MNDTFFSGKIGRPFGVEGDLVVDSYSGGWEHLLALKELRLLRDGKEQVVSVDRWTEKGSLVLVRLSGCAAPETARRWTGWEIGVFRSQAPRLEHEEYYLSDLVGCSLVFSGRRVGTVKGWLEGGAHALLEVAKDSGETSVLPFLKKFVGSVDTQNHVIELLEEWILE